MSSPFGCPQVRVRLAECVSGELGPGERDQVTEHLKGCESCRHELERLSQAMAAVRGARPLDRKSLPCVAPGGGCRGPDIPPPLDTEASSPILAAISRPLTFAGLGLVAVLLLIGILFQSMQGPPAAQPGTPASFTLGNMIQGVSLTSGELELIGTGIKAPSGGMIPIGAHCRALVDSQLEFRSGHRFLVRAETTFLIGPNEVVLEVGAGRFSVRPGQGGFRVRTPSATLGIRGTRFEVVVVASGTAVDLTEGRIEIEAGGIRTDLAAGELLICSSGKPPRKHPSPGGFWEKWIEARGEFDRFIRCCEPQTATDPKAAPTMKPPPTEPAPSPDDQTVRGEPESGQPETAPDEAATRTPAVTSQVSPDGF